MLRGLSKEKCCFFSENFLKICWKHRFLTDTLGSGERSPRTKSAFIFFLSPVVFLFHVRYFEHVFGATRFYWHQFFFVFGGISGFI